MSNNADKTPDTSKGRRGSFRRGKAATGSKAKGRGGLTRDAVPPVRGPEKRDARGSTRRLAEGETFERGVKRKAPPKVGKGSGKRPPQRQHVQLDAPPETTTFRDMDGHTVTFPDSKLRRIAAQILQNKNKRWRYRPFPFPLFTDKGTEQTFHFDFYVYDAENTVIRLILAVPNESREIWDKVGRFKRQYPMYDYELWTPERLAALQKGRGKGGRLEF